MREGKKVPPYRSSPETPRAQALVWGGEETSKIKKISEKGWGAFKTDKGSYERKRRRGSELAEGCLRTDRGFMRGIQEGGVLRFSAY